MSPQSSGSTPAQSAWVARFDGPILHREVVFGSPLIRHQFKRSFEHVGRNVHMVSVFGRVLLGEEKIIVAEEAIYKRIEEITTAIERKAAMTLVVLKEANIEVGQLATYNKPVHVLVDIVVPAQSKFVKLLEKADIYAQGFFTLWLEGEITDKEKSKNELELKKLLRQIPATTRKMRIFIQAKLEESEHEDAKKEAKAMVADAVEEVEDDDAALPLTGDGIPVAPPAEKTAKTRKTSKPKANAAASESTEPVAAAA